MKNVFKIDLLILKMRQLLELETEQNFKMVLSWLLMLADSLSIDEKVEAIKISDGLDSIKSFLAEKHFFEDEMQYRYFQTQQREILAILDRISNPDDYPAEELASKKMSFSERQIKLIDKSLDTEFIPYAKHSVC